MVCQHDDLGGALVAPVLSRRDQTHVRELLQTPKKEHAKPAPKAAEPAKAAKVDAAKPVPAPAVKEVRSSVLSMSQPTLFCAATTLARLQLPVHELKCVWHST